MALATISEVALKWIGVNAEDALSHWNEPIIPVYGVKRNTAVLAGQMQYVAVVE